LEKETLEHRAGRVRNLEIEHRQIEQELKDLYDRESENIELEQASAVGMSSGATGQQGPDGRKGPDGQPGPQGQRGQQGQQGPIEVQCPQGPQGHKGPQGQGAGNAGIDPDDFRAFSAAVATGTTNMTATNYRKDIPQYSDDLDDSINI
jgi:hypothetical protein